MTKEIREACLNAFVQQDSEIHNAFLHFMGKVNDDIANGKYTLEEFKRHKLGSQSNNTQFTSTEEV